MGLGRDSLESLADSELAYFSCSLHESLPTLYTLVPYGGKPAEDAPRHSRSCIADMSAAARVSRLPWVAPMPPASSHLHPSGDPASRTVLTTSHLLRGFLFFHFRQSGLCRVPILG